MAETIARIGKDVTGRYADVTASVSNFIPKPHTRVSVERLAVSRVFPLGAPLSEIESEDPLGDGEVPTTSSEACSRGS